MRTSLRTLLLLAVLAGCGSQSVTESADDELRGRRVARCPIEESGACRAVEPRDVATISSGALQMPGFSYATGNFVAAIGARYSDGRVITATTDDRKTFGPVLPIPWFGGDVTGADVAGRKMLYFIGDTGAGIGLVASSLRDLEVHPPVVVTIEDSPIVPYWPQAAALPDGRTLLAFVESQKRAFLAVDDKSGLRFRAQPWPNVSGELRGVLAHVGTTAGGSWVITHQIADANWMFTSWVQTSKDGTSWSSPSKIQADSADVHDAFPIPRADSGADLYYLHTSPEGEFTAFRRALHEDGTLGPEQAVTSAAVGHIEKPQPRRLPDGRIALMFAIRKTPMTYDLAMAFLAGDAPP